MLTNIHFPWGSGLGRLGFRFSERYVDFGFIAGKLQKFVANYEVFDRSHWTDRSWYTLTRRGWKLTKREDKWGQWSVRGQRRPQLINRPKDTFVRALELRKYFSPYQMIDWYGEELEVISYPCPEANRMVIMLRRFNDSTTLRQETIEEYV